jgi:DNA-binding FrmR family transcriptional regulator
MLLGKNNIESDAQVADCERKSIIDRLKKIEGQARGIQKMVMDGRNCDEVIMQIAALKAAAAQVGSMVLSSYLIECVRKEVETEENPELTTEKVAKVLRKFV